MERGHVFYVDLIKINDTELEIIATSEFLGGVNEDFSVFKELHIDCHNGHVEGYIAGKKVIESNVMLFGTKYGIYGDIYTIIEVDNLEVRVFKGKQSEYMILYKVMIYYNFKKGLLYIVKIVTKRKVEIFCSFKS